MLFYAPPDPSFPNIDPLALDLRNRVACLLYGLYSIEELSLDLVELVADRSVGLTDTQLACTGRFVRIVLQSALYGDQPLEQVARCLQDLVERGWPDNGFH